MIIDDKLTELYSADPYRVFNATSFKGIPGGTKSSIYGEISRDGAETLLSRLNLEGLLNSETIFYDLGSGLGRLVMHACLKYPINAVGIEFSKERYKYSTQLYKNLKLTNATFINGDYFKCNISNATLIFIDDTCQRLSDVILMFDDDLLPDEFVIVSTTDEKYISAIKDSKFEVVPDTKQIVIPKVVQTYTASRVFYACRIRKRQ